MNDTPFEEALGLHRQGQFARADILYRVVLAQNPAHFDALHLLGVVQHQQGRHAAAIELIEQALAVNPHVALAYSNKAAALQALERYEEALHSCDQGLAHDPACAEALSNRGNALQQLCRFEEALASQDAALAFLPHYPQALCNRAAALLELGQPSEAAAACEQALALQPRYAQAHYNRGNALKKLGNAGEAARSYAHALALDPSYGQAHHNLADLLIEARQHEAAARGYAKVIELGHDYPYVAGTMLNARLHACDWGGYASLASRVREEVRTGRRADMPFAFAAISDSPADQLQCARTYTAHRFPPGTPLWAGERYRHDRIRVAYLSSTFHDHAVSRLLIGVLERHDKALFEITAVSFAPGDGQHLRARIRGCCDEFHDAQGTSDRGIAQLLHDKEIDIAVDLDGHTDRRSRPGVLALRPAPVQVNYLGFPGTMGAPYIDYLIADSWLIRPEETAFYDENVVRLPEAYQPNDNTRAISERTPSRAEAGLPDDGFVFCCFNNNYKIAPHIFAIWMRLLAAVPGSVLWLLEDSAAAARNLRRSAQDAGIDAARLVFAQRTNQQDHLARHRLADLFVDTLPYNAHTTASDALWAGLPLLTCSGGTFAGRVAGSLLHAAGLPELVTQDLRAYEELALALATDPARLAALRGKIARTRDAMPLFDTERSCRHLEAAYTTMWERSQQVLPAQPFDVPPLPAR